VMVTTAVTALAEKYCSEGVPVEYQEYPGLSHVEAAGPFLAYAVPYLLDRFQGGPAVSNCGAIETGSAPNVYPSGSTCNSSSTTGSCTATWSADVTGWYWGYTTGTWELQQLKCKLDDSSCSWETTASGGEGPFGSPPGTLTAGNVYQVIVDGEGEAAIGSWTGTGPA
jgi:hypothetical protein